MGHSVQPDAFFIEQVMQGRPEAFGVLVERYLPVARAVALAQTRNLDDADDVAQEALLKAYTSLGRLRDPKRFGAWLATITRNVALSSLRQQARQAAVTHSVLPDTVLEPDVVRRELYAKVRAYVDELAPSLRETVLLHYFAGRKLREIADLHGITPNAAEKRLSRARTALGGRILEELMPEEEEGAKSGEVHKLMGLVAVAPAPWTVSGAAGLSVPPILNKLGGLVVTNKIVAGVTLCTALALAVWVGLSAGKKDEEPVVKREEIASVGAIAQEAVPLEVEVTDPIEGPSEPPRQTVEAEDPPEAPTSPDAVAEIPEGMFQVGGKVVNTAGQAVPGAFLTLYHHTKSWGLDDRIEDTTESKGSGEFLFPVLVGFDKDVNHSYDQDTFTIVATHDEYALAWSNVRPAADYAHYRITMTAPAARILAVVDEAGAPIEDALVWPYSFGSSKSPDPNFRDYFSVDGHAPFASQLSDAQGEARFENLPETDVSFHASKPGYARGLAFPRGDTIVLTGGATLSGRVVTEGGQPVAEARVRLEATWMHQYEMARTDEQGRYAFLDIAADGWDMSPWAVGKVGTGSYNVLLRSDEYTAEQSSIQLFPGDVIDGYDIVAHAGTLIRCSVVTSDTNEPLAGARVQGFTESGRLNGFTDKDGLVEFRVLGGDTRLFMVSPPDGVYLITESPTNGGLLNETMVEFLAEGAEVEITLVSPPIGGGLVTVSGSVTWLGVDKPGEIVIGASTVPGIELAGLSGGYGATTGVNEDGTFEFKDVPEGLMLQLHALSKDNRFGGVGAFFIEGDGDSSTPVKLVLEPAYEVDVDLADEDGQPIVNTKARVAPVVNGVQIWRSLQHVWVDETGRITVEGTLRGVAYRIETGAHIDAESRPPFFDETVVLVP